MTEPQMVYAQHAEPAAPVLSPVPAPGWQPTPEGVAALQAKADAIRTARTATARLASGEQSVRDAHGALGDAVAQALSGIVGHERMRTAVLATVRKYGAAAAALAAEHYRAERAAAGVKGRLTVVHAPPAPLGQVASMIGWATRTLDTDQPDPVQAEKNLTAGAERLVLNAGRMTVIGNVHRDPKAHGWVRVPETSVCGFCAFESIGGPVGRADTQTRFRAHDHCRCHAAPTFGPYQLPERVAAWRSSYLGAAVSRRDWQRAFNDAHATA